MYLEPDQKYQIRVKLENHLQGIRASECETILQNNLNFLHHLTCSAAGTVIEVVFNPPDDITDKFVFEKIFDTLRNASISYVNAILGVYVGSNKRKATGGAIGGGLAGLKFGWLGTIVGSVIGVGASMLFDWKDMCECVDDNFGQLVIRYFN